MGMACRRHGHGMPTAWAWHADSMPERPKAAAAPTLMTSSLAPPKILSRFFLRPSLHAARRREQTCVEQSWLLSIGRTALLLAPQLACSACAGEAGAADEIQAQQVERTGRMPWLPCASMVQPCPPLPMPMSCHLHATSCRANHAHPLRARSCHARSCRAHAAPHTPATPSAPRHPRPLLCAASAPPHRNANLMRRKEKKMGKTRRATACSMGMMGLMGVSSINTLQLKGRSFRKAHAKGDMGRYCKA